MKLVTIRTCAQIGEYLVTLSSVVRSLLAVAQLYHSNVSLRETCEVCSTVDSLKSRELCGPPADYLSLHIHGEISKILYQFYLRILLQT